jgi:Protein kinase domain
MNKSSLFDFNSHIIQAKADSSIDREGGKTVAGKSIKRLKLSDNDSRLFIAAKIITKNSHLIERLEAYLGKALGFYVEVKKENDSTLLLNINSLANRLHWSKDSIQKAAKEGNLDKLLDKQTRFIKTTLTTADQSQRLGISTRFLMERDQVGNFKRDQEEIRIRDKSYFFHVNKKGQIKIAQISQRLGAGSFAEAVLITDLATKKEKVLKQAIKTQGIEARKDIINEFNLLSEIHAKGKVWGIQAKPQKIIALKESNSYQHETRFGILGKKYDGNYFNYIQKTFTLSSYSTEDLLLEFHQLLSGLSYLEKKGILHGDLKPENILVKKVDGILLTHIADLGGARQTKGLSIREIPRTTYTSCCYPKEDQQSVANFLILNDKAKVIQVEQKSDVFALGLILYMGITGTTPFIEDKEFRPILSTYIELPNFTPQEIQGLIKQMLHKDYNQRPSAKEALEKMEEFIQKQSPNLYKKIQDLQQKY